MIAPAIAISSPPPGGGAREAMLVRSILPLAASYLLMMSLMLSGSWMLQGTVEERSNKLLETVLACISPEELMYGKLLGTIGVGFSMVAAWIACGVVRGLCDARRDRRPHPPGARPADLARHHHHHHLFLRRRVYRDLGAVPGDRRDEQFDARGAGLSDAGVAGDPDADHLSVAGDPASAAAAC